MKYYSDITNKLYETREELFKAERDYKTKLIAKARADEKSRKIADLEAQLAELKGESAKTTTTPSIDTVGDRIDVPKTQKTAPSKTSGACEKCGKCVKPDTNESRKRGKLADSGYYSSAYVNLNGKEFHAEGADSWNDVKRAIREYFDKLQGLK